MYPRPTENSKWETGEERGEAGEAEMVEKAEDVEAASDTACMRRGKRRPGPRMQHSGRFGCGISLGPLG